MSLSMDHGEVDRWAVKLTEAASRSPREAAAVVGKGALNIKNGARRRSGGLAHAPAYPYSIGYDQWMSFGGPVAEIGPDKGKRQGPLGNILEYGTEKNAPIPHIAPSADEELPRFERACENLGESLLEKP